MRRAWRRNREQADDDVVDVRGEETIDLRSDPASRSSDYHCMTIHLPPVRDDAADAWARAGSLVSYSSDLLERRTDRRREDLRPGPRSADVDEAEETDTH